jgi:hypothetical protein
VLAGATPLLQPLLALSAVAFNDARQACFEACVLFVVPHAMLLERVLSILGDRTIDDDVMYTT